MNLKSFLTSIHSPIPDAAEIITLAAHKCPLS